MQRERRFTAGARATAILYSASHAPAECGSEKVWVPHDAGCSCSLVHPPHLRTPGLPHPHHQVMRCLPRPHKQLPIAPPLCEHSSSRASPFARTCLRATPTYHLLAHPCVCGGGRRPPPATGWRAATTATGPAQAPPQPPGPLLPHRRRRAFSRNATHSLSHYSLSH